MKRLFVAVLFAAALPCFGECITQWGYANDSKGPDNWYRLGPPPPNDWHVCKDGIAQSPIDISIANIPPGGLPELVFNNLPTTSFKLYNKGQELKVEEVTPAWTLTWNGQPWTLQNFHFHVPAEHTYGGQRYAGEIHFVFERGTQAVAVAVWIRQGTPANETLRKIIAVKPQSCQNPPGHSAEPIRMSDFLLSPRRYASYRGSLTTPSCSENVTFVIQLAPITATAAQIQALKILPNLPLGNARPLQRIKWRNP
jgi:carbonic anhydrase